MIENDLHNCSVLSPWRFHRADSRTAMPPLLDADDHGVGASEMLHSSLPESLIVHPSNAISAGVVEPAVSLDHHLKAHHKAEGVFAAIVVDDRVVYQQCAAPGKRFVRLPNQPPLFFEIPVVQDVSHHDHVRLWQRLGEEAAGLELHSRGEAVDFNVLLENRGHLAQIKSDDEQVLVLESHLNK